MEAGPKALFQCPDCDEERETLLPPLDTPEEWLPHCYCCGAVLWLMHLILEYAI